MTIGIRDAVDGADRVENDIGHFISHCLLNQNTRYLGGAVCPGTVVDAIDSFVSGGMGIVQMECPEQRS